MTYNNNVARLEVAEAYPEDEGQYVCSAENVAGKVQTAAKLFVDGEGYFCVCFCRIFPKG